MRDPFEQPLATLSLRLHAAHTYAVSTPNDMRQHEPQTEIVAQTGRDGDCLGGPGGLVNSTQDGFHYRLLSIGEAAPRRNR